MIFIENNITAIEIGLLEMVKGEYKLYSSILNNVQELLCLVLELDKKVNKAEKNDDKIILKKGDVNKLKKILFLCNYDDGTVIKMNNIDKIIEQKLDEKFDTIPVFVEVICDLFSNRANSLIDEISRLEKSEKPYLHVAYSNSLNIVRKRLIKCKTINELVDSTYEFYLDNDVHIKMWAISIFMTFISNIQRNMKELNEQVQPFKACKKKMKRFIEDYENGNVVSADDAKEILCLYNPYAIEKNEATIIEEIKKHNEEAYINEKQKKNSIARLEVHYETREERMSRYNNGNNENYDYKDVGEVSLTSEEVECLELYFSVIEELDDNKIEDFENKTSEFLPLLLDNYSDQLIISLINKIQNSDINPQIQKRACKAIRHLI